MPGACLPTAFSALHVQLSISKPFVLASYPLHAPVYLKVWSDNIRHNSVREGTG